MKINSQLVQILRQHHIDVDEGLTCLLALHFNLKLTAITEKTFKQINLTKIVERDYKNTTLKWNYPLFEGQQKPEWSWVDDWRAKFKAINPDRAGDKQACIKRMRKFFSENPSVRTQEVFAATDLYFRGLSDPQYLKKAHKFIYEGAGVNSSSMLKEYLERVREADTLKGNKRGLL